MPSPSTLNLHPSNETARLRNNPRTGNYLRAHDMATSAVEKDDWDLWKEREFIENLVCVAKVFDVKSAVPEQLR
jgi:hypothetical protein